MSRTKIDWATDVINPITGCNNNCEYCYARRFAQRLRGRFGYPADEPFRPTFHIDRLKASWGGCRKLKGKGKRIFLDSMGDWFSEGVELDWIRTAVWFIFQNQKHNFIVLTKRPDRIKKVLKKRDFNFPECLWFGVSVTCQEDVWRIDELKHSLRGVNYVKHLVVSFEPLHGPIEADLTGIGWAIIGAETGNRKGKIVPELKWVKQIARDADRLGIPVFIKNNLQELYRQQPGCLGGVQDFPKEMRR